LAGLFIGQVVQQIVLPHGCAGQRIDDLRDPVSGIELVVNRALVSAAGVTEVPFAS
jgi:hypothetical protein